MKKNIFEIYCYLVCLLTLMCAVVVLGLFAYNIVRISYPDFTLENRDVKRFSSNENYVQAEDFRSRKDEKYRNRFENMAEEEITKLRLDEHQLEIRMQRRAGFQNLVRHGIVLGIDLLVFFIHWKMGRKEKLSAE